MFALSLIRIEHPAYLFKEILHANGLVLIAVKPFSQHRLTVISHGGSGDRNDGYTLRLWVSTKLLQSCNSIHSGELDVHEYEGRRFFQGEFEPFFGCFTLDGLVALNLEHVAHELAVLLVVFDDKDQFASHYPSPLMFVGSVKVKVEPLPTSLSTQIFPPCSSTNFLAKVSPSPVPSILCVESEPTCRNSSK